MHLALAVWLGTPPLHARRNHLAFEATATPPTPRQDISTKVQQKTAFKSEVPEARVWSPGARGPPWASSRGPPECRNLGIHMKNS